MIRNIYKIRYSFLIAILIFFIPSLGFTAKYEIHFSPLSEEEIGKRHYDKINLDNGLVATIEHFMAKEVGTDFGKSGRENYVFRWTGGLVRYPATMTITGYELSLLNNSDKPLIIKWSNSSISIAGKNGLPFLSGMKYINAGNPSATPNTIIPPGEIIKLQVYLPAAQFNRGWDIEGVPVPKEGTIDGFIVLCVLDDNNIEKYHTLYAWPIKAFEVDEKNKK